MKWSLKRIEIAGFKSIREAKLSLSSLNLMIGANGAGKSNLVAAFALLNRIVEGQLQTHVARKGGGAAFLHNGPKHTKAIRLRLDFANDLGLENSYEAQIEFGQDDSPFFAAERCYIRDPSKYERPWEKSLGAGHKESLLPSGAGKIGVEKYVLEAMESCVVYHFHDTSDAAPVKRRGKIDDNESLRVDASNLAAFLYRLRKKSPNSYKRIVAAIRQVAPFFGDFNLRPDRIREDEIKLEWTEKDSDAYFDAHSLSDGTLRFVCLATLLLQPSLPSLILIDEPELGLHPYAITQLAALFRSAASRTQVLAATQSVTLMNQFDPEQVIVVDRDDGQSTFRRIKEKEISAWADSYALGDLWEKAVIGGRPKR